MLHWVGFLGFLASKSSAGEQISKVNRSVGFPKIRLWCVVYNVCNGLHVCWLRDFNDKELARKREVQACFPPKKE